MSFDNFKNSGSQRKGRTKEKPIQEKGIQCHECEIFGHVRAECPTFLKKQKKGMSTTWSDDELEGAHNDEATNYVMAFTRKCETFDEFCHDDLSYEELADSYKQLYFKCEEICQVGEGRRKSLLICVLKKKNSLIISGLQDEVTF